VLVNLTVVAVLLAVGNIVFRRFDPRMPLRKRVLKIIAVLTVTAMISYYFGRSGVIVAFAIAMLPIIYIHGVWLPRHGVNGWTGEPREKYYALRGWPSPKR